MVLFLILLSVWSGFRLSCLFVWVEFVVVVLV